MTNPSQQNKEILEKFREEFCHSKFCREFPEAEPKNCRCDYEEYQLFILSSLEQKDAEKEKAVEGAKEGQDEAEKDGRYWHYLEIEDLEKRTAEKALADYKAELVEKIENIKIDPKNEHTPYWILGSARMKKNILSLINSKQI